jgi:hypothetical protein
VSLQLIAVETRHCRLLYIIPVASELILPEIRRRQCRVPTINRGRETALPCPLYYSGNLIHDRTNRLMLQQTSQHLHWLLVVRPRESMAESCTLTRLQLPKINDIKSQ